ncbi:MAG: hypothetical protein IJG46_03635 [Prevotella sp.]|nr:hypothetical protein [Prevotella sp.]
MSRAAAERQCRFGNPPAGIHLLVISSPKSGRVLRGDRGININYHMPPPRRLSASGYDCRIVRRASSASNTANGYYWSATARDASYVHNMNFNTSNVNGNNWNQPGNGFSVRLFAEASAVVTTISF